MNKLILRVNYIVSQYHSLNCSIWRFLCWSILPSTLAVGLDLDNFNWSADLAYINIGIYLYVYKGLSCSVLFSEKPGQKIYQQRWCLVSSTRGRQITPVKCSLHWLKLPKCVLHHSWAASQLLIPILCPCQDITAELVHIDIGGHWWSWQ